MHVKNNYNECITNLACSKKYNFINTIFDLVM